MKKTVFVRIGRFLRPHGLKGEILVHSFTEDPLAIGTYGPVYALAPETPTLLLEDNLPHPFVLNHVRHGPQEKSVLVSLEGVTTRTDVETFLNKPLDVFIPRKRLKDDQLGKEEFFHADLIGLQAYNNHGDLIGRVVALHNYGAGDILEIEPMTVDQNVDSTCNKHKKRVHPTFMIPFRQAFVPKVDLENQCLTVIYNHRDKSTS